MCNLWFERLLTPQISLWRYHDTPIGTVRYARLAGTCFPNGIAAPYNRAMAAAYAMVWGACDAADLIAAMKKPRQNPRTAPAVRKRTA